MCALTLLTLSFPETFAWLWRIKPEARADFIGLGGYAFLLMSVVGLACAFAAIGLAQRAPWGRVLALVILTVNLLGDSLGAIMRHDYRTLIGLPIGGAMIFYLARAADKFNQPGPELPANPRS